MLRDKKIIQISILGIIINLILVIFKLIVGFFTNSIAITLDAINNLSDAFSSIITIVGMKLSNKRPDKKHPYGYGRIEYFSSIIIAILVILAGIVSFKESFFKILSPIKANYNLVSLIIILVGVLVKFFLGKYLKNKGKYLNSSNLLASGIDALSDSILSLATFISALFNVVFNYNLEGYLGIIISIMIIKSAFSILKETINDIIGIRADASLTKKIKEKILSFNKVLGVYDLTLHNYGPNKIIATAHIQVKDDEKAREIHRLSRRIMIEIYENFGIIITLGVYASNDTLKYKKIKEYITKLVSNYDNIIQFHGFYVDEEIKVITFDLIFNFEERKSDEIVKEISDSLKNKYPRYDFNIIIDIDFSD